MLRSSSFRLLALALAGVFALLLAPVASAQTTPSSSFEHDDSRDGTENEVIGNFFQIIPPGSGSPEDQRNAIVEFLEANDDDNDFTPPDTTEPWGWETHEFTVPEGDQNGSFSVTIRWSNPDVDLDLYVYRREDDGSYTLVASSAAGGTTQEQATYAPAPPPDTSDDPNSTDPPQSPTEPGVVPPGTYVAYVDNWCSDDDDPLDQELAEDYGADFCDQGGYIDEDDWIGEITFTAPSATNQLPHNVSISGPDRAATGENVTFTASAEDADGTIERYAFDLDGDGRFEYDGAQFASVSKRYDTPGTYNVGVRVMDDRGGFGFANRTITITGPALAPAGLAANVSKPQAVEPLQSFKLSGPQFGGTRGRSLIVRFRLTQAARVTAVLYRGNKRIRRLTRRDAVANRTYRTRVRARGLRRGLYTVRLTVVTESGETQRARLSSTRL